MSVILGATVSEKSFNNEAGKGSREEEVGLRERMTCAISSVLALVNADNCGLTWGTAFAT